MKRNIGNIDMIIRLFGAILFTDLAIDRASYGHWNILYWLLAIALGFTALMGYCPLYALFHIGSHAKHHRHE